MNAAIANHLNVIEDAILEVQEWTRVLWVRVKGVGCRFVSKKVVKKMEVKIPVKYMGSYTFSSGEWADNLVISGRFTSDRKRGYSLDCPNAFEYKDFLKTLGFKWESSEKVWYFVSSDANEIIKLACKIAAHLIDLEHPTFSPTLGLDKGTPNFSKLDSYFKKNSKFVSSTVD